MSRSSLALSAELEGVLAWVPCIAGAGPMQEYLAFVEGAGLRVARMERPGYAPILAALPEAAYG